MKIKLTKEQVQKIKEAKLKIVKNQTPVKK